MKGAETIVVGGGVMGATVAYELAREDADVLLLDAGRFAAGSTAKSGAIVRCHYSNPEVVRMAVRSRDRLQQLPLHLDCDPVYTRCGWLFLVDEDHADAAVRNAEMQDEEGVDSVDVDDLEAYVPGIDPDGIAYAVFEPDSGFADPVATTRAYVDAALRAGARGEEGVQVESIGPDGVRAGGELVECDRVVLACGPWSAKLAATAGVELPLEITREQDVIFESSPETPIGCSVSSQVDRVYLRPAGDGGMLVGRGYPKEYEVVDPESYDATLDDSFEQDVRGRLTGRVPRLAGMRAVGGGVGLFDVTPDWHPILGRVDGHEWLHLAVGGSGHCFKLAPAIGELVAWQILGREARYADIRSFSLARFAENRVFASSYGGNRA